jgi:hypothetical protein
MPPCDVKLVELSFEDAAFVPFATRGLPCVRLVADKVCPVAGDVRKQHATLFECKRECDASAMGEDDDWPMEATGK